MLCVILFLELKSLLVLGILGSKLFDQSEFIETLTHVCTLMSKYNYLVKYLELMAIYLRLM